MTWANSRPLCCPHGQQTIDAVNDWENHSLFSACKHFNVQHRVSPALFLYPNHCFWIPWGSLHESKSLNLVSANAEVGPYFLQSRVPTRNSDKLLPLYLLLFHWIMDFSNLAVSPSVKQFHNLALLLVLNVRSGWLQEHLRRWGTS